ncbi:hypothetical protein EDB83DRAFT_153716 [Lactarius deliciosus]|nr:hypothetical protein EDB83DRAFT_153716 [Lactarius deliciosus]
MPPCHLPVPYHPELDPRSPSMIIDFTYLHSRLNLSRLARSFLFFASTRSFQLTCFPFGSPPGPAPFCLYLPLWPFAGLCIGTYEHPRAFVFCMSLCNSARFSDFFMGYEILFTPAMVITIDKTIPTTFPTISFCDHFTRSGCYASIVRRNHVPHIFILLTKVSSESRQT